MTIQKPTKTKIMNWLSVNDFEIKTISDNKMQFGYEVKRGNIVLVLTRKKGDSKIMIHARFILTPEQKRVYTKEKDREFKSSIKKEIASYGTDVQFLPDYQYALIDFIYDDGFSFHQLFTSLKRVTLAGVSSIEILNSVLGLKSSVKKEEKSPSYFG